MTAAKATSRIIIYTHDVQKFAGCSRNTAKRWLRKVREHYQKRDRDAVTFVEFCTYMKWDERSVREGLGS